LLLKETIVTGRIRLNLQVSKETNELLTNIVNATGSNRTDVIRQALALMKVAQTARQDGRYLGVVSDPNKLDREIVSLI
jgi:hypothetical protein